MKWLNDTAFYETYPQSFYVANGGILRLLDEYLPHYEMVPMDSVPLYDLGAVTLTVPCSHGRAEFLYLEN